MPTIAGTKAFEVGKDVPLRLKVDWLSFTVSTALDNKNNEDFYLLKKLGYNVSDFKEILGKNFFNSGLSYGNGFIRLFFNDSSKPLQKGSTNDHQYLFSGVGCSDLHQKINGDWVGLFKYLRKFGVRFRRVDLAVDDLSYPSRISFDYIERKLAKEEFKSSKRRYNVISNFKTENKKQNVRTGKTVYWGSKKTSGANGHSLLRIYQKAYELIESKKQAEALPPEVLLQQNLPDFDGEFNWMRWELEITKAKADALIDLILKKSEKVDNPLQVVFGSILLDVVTFLVPTKNSNGEIYKNKNKWKISQKYLDFLGQSEKAKLENPDKLYDLGSVLNWIKYSVTPSLQLCFEVFSQVNVDFFDILRNFVTQNPAEYSKKQERLLLESKTMKPKELALYITQFMRERGK